MTTCGDGAEVGAQDAGIETRQDGTREAGQDLARIRGGRVRRRVGAGRSGLAVPGVLTVEAYSSGLLFLRTAVTDRRRQFVVQGGQ